MWVDVLVPLVVEQVIEVAKISGFVQKKILRIMRTHPVKMHFEMLRVIEALVVEMFKVIVEVEKLVSQNICQQRTVERPVALSVLEEGRIARSNKRKEKKPAREETQEQQVKEKNKLAGARRLH